MAEEPRTGLAARGLRTVRAPLRRRPLSDDGTLSTQGLRWRPGRPRAARAVAVAVAPGLWAADLQQRNAGQLRLPAGPRVSQIHWARSSSLRAKGAAVSGNYRRFNAAFITRRACSG